MSKKTYQDWCIDTLYDILLHRDEYLGSNADQGYIYSIKAIINHYSSMFYCEETFCRNKDKKYLNLWWDHINKTNIKFAFNSLLISKNAYEILTKYIDDESFDPKDLKKFLHFEHATPVAFTYNQLMSINKDKLTKEAIEDCFKCAKIVLITKEESNYLDGSNCRFMDGEFNGMQIKDTGWGDVRLEHLINKGVKFVDIKGNVKDYKEYLKEKKYEIGLVD